jgi:DNA-binding NtrC family response regulator
MKTMETNSPLKIFLVDDEPYCLNLYAQYFVNLGYRNIHSFGNSAECLNQLTEGPDAIFLDYHMDNLNGIEMLKKIKRFNPNVMVFFVSGQESISVAVNSLKYGAFDYIIKQDMSEERIKGCMEKAERIREILLKKKRGGIIKKLFVGIGASSMLFFLQRIFAKI